MIDPIQILIIVVISILTVLLLVIGIEIFFVLKETKKSLTKLNDSLDKFDHVMGDIEIISQSVATPVNKFSHIIMGLQQGAGVVRFLTQVFNKVSDKNDHNK